MTKTIYSTVKQTVKEFHAVCGEFTSTRWTEYTVSEVQWRSGKTTKHLNVTHYINGVVDSAAQWSTEDSLKIAAEMGLAV